MESRERDAEMRRCGDGECGGLKWDFRYEECQDGGCGIGDALS